VRVRRSSDLSVDWDFLREYAYMAEQIQRARFSTAHFVSLAWLGLSKTGGDVEYVARVIAQKLRYTATHLPLFVEQIQPPEAREVATLVLRGVVAPRPGAVAETRPLQASDTSLAGPGAPMGFVEYCHSVRKTFGDVQEVNRCVKRCMDVANAPLDSGASQCLDAETRYELGKLLAEYRMYPMGLEDWQIAMRVAGILSQVLSRAGNCDMDRLVKYIAKELDGAGVDRYSVRRAYIHGVSPGVVELLYRIFPNLTPKIGGATELRPPALDKPPRLEESLRPTEHPP